MRVQCPPIRSHLNSVDLKQTEKGPFYSFFIILHCLSEVIPAKSCIDSKKNNAVIIGEEAKNHAIHLFPHFKSLLWNYEYLHQMNHKSCFLLFQLRLFGSSTFANNKYTKYKPNSADLEQEYVRRMYR